MPFVYVVQPDWWQVEVVGCFDPDTPTLPVTAPYEIRRKVTFWGKKGIVLQGAGFKKEFSAP